MNRVAAFAGLLAFALAVCASSVTMVWDENPPDEGVIGYRVYEEVGTNYVLVGTESTNTITLTNVVPGQHTWVVSAVNAIGQESGHSNPASTNLLSPITNPTGLRITVIVTVETP